MGDPSAAVRARQDDLVDRIAAGDRMAEAEFVRRYAIGVRALIRRQARPNDPVVDDLAQDVLSNVLQKLRNGALRDNDALPAYVRSAVTFATQAEYRHRAAQRTESISISTEQIADERDPADLVERAALRARLVQLMQDLPKERDRELLVRFYLRDETKETICRALQIDEAHFRRVIFRARDRLRVLCEQAGLGRPR